MVCVNRHFLSLNTTYASEYSWLSAIRALAALSSLSPASLGLSKLSSSTPYFPRQIKSLSRVSLAQAEAVDVESGKKAGKIPKFDEMIKWYSSHLPDESKTGGLRIVHGDYKLDNMVFHATEPKVIGILDWELCTLGSPVGRFYSVMLERHTQMHHSWQTLLTLQCHGHFSTPPHPWWKREHSFHPSNLPELLPPH